MTTLANVRKQLEARKAELVDRIDRIIRDRMHTEGAVSPDFAEQAVERENDEVLDRLESSAQADMRHIVRALARLGSGRYGMCEACGDRIEAERLAAVIHATRCSSCAGTAEAKAA